jgi:transcriptional regulator GlxA family with amidase domain
MAARRVVVLVFPEVQAIDVFGPVEVFATAERLAGGDEYAIEVIASGAAPIQTSSGVGIAARSAKAAGLGKLDTLIVAGGDGVGAALGDRGLLDLVATTAGDARRVCSVCTGAFLLAEAGLLDGRRATTHWSACAELARRYPAVSVEPEPIFVRDGNVATSAGVSAGIDLALALVEEDQGPQDWIPAHLDEDLSVAALAERASMSPRNFARAFRREIGATPAAYVEWLRVESARARLQSSDSPVEAVARECGFGTVETLRRAFQRRVGVSPSEYRQRFKPALQPA